MSNGHPKDPGRKAHTQDDSVGKLIQLAGKREQVDEIRAARVRARVHTHWQESLHANRPWQKNWGWLAMASAAVVVAGLGLSVWLPPAGNLPGESTMPRVVALSGEAWVLQDGDLDPDRRIRLATGDTIPLLSTIMTGPAGRVALDLSLGASVRLDHATHLIFTAKNAATLQAGAIYVDSGRQAPGPEPALEVHTDWGIVRERGTQFQVRLTVESQEVAVREGAVTLENEEESFHLAAGTTLTLSRDGAVRSESPADGPLWSWVTRVSPPQNLQGRTLLSFLKWVCREKGWRLSFADTRVAAATRETTLSGSTAGLTLDEALEAVLAATPFTYRAADGLLAIDDPEDATARP